MRLEGKVAIVTGAGSGIGRGVSLRFAEEGASIVVADIDGPRAAETVALVGEAGGNAVAVTADVSKGVDVKRLFSEALSAFDGFDILANTAGILTWAPLLEITEEMWDRMLEVNLKSMFLCTQEAARYWVREKRKGRIVNLGSVNSDYAIPGNAHYSAAKGAVKMFTRAAAVELAPYRINVNAVGPGGTQTNITEAFQDPEQVAAMEKNLPWGRIAQPRDIANVILMLASDDAEYVSGQLVFVDGGLTSKMPGT